MPNSEWTPADVRLLGFYVEAEKRLRAILHEVALTGWRSNYTESRLAQVQEIVEDLKAKQATWARRELPAAYNAAKVRLALAYGDTLLFNAIDEELIASLILGTEADVSAALRGIVPDMERLYISARQIIIPAQQLDYQIAHGIVQGLPATEIGKRIVDALQTGATERLKDLLDESTRKIIQRAASGHFVAVLCKDGKLRHYGLRHYSELVAKTTRSLAARRAVLQSAAEYGFDLVRVSVHVGACSKCIPRQGIVYSLTGATRGFPVASADDLPPYHPVCGHSIWPVSAEILEAANQLEAAQRFVGDQEYAVTSGDEYAAVMAGASRGTLLTEALATAEAH